MEAHLVLLSFPLLSVPLQFLFSKALLAFVMFTNFP